MEEEKKKEKRVEEAIRFCECREREKPPRRSRIFNKNMIIATTTDFAGLNWTGAVVEDRTNVLCSEDEQAKYISNSS